MSIRELDELELMDVSGGWRAAIGAALRDTIVQDLARHTLDNIYSSVAAAGRWLLRAAPGGADDTTWTNVGHSGMGA